MSGSRTGTPTIISLSRTICRIHARYGAADLLSATTPEFAAAVLALTAACAAFVALDDYPAEVDTTPPLGPEDIEPGVLSMVRTSLRR